MNLYSILDWIFSSSGVWTLGGIAVISASLFVLNLKFVRREDTFIVVDARYFDPAHDTTQMMLVGKVMVPQIIHHPDQFAVHGVSDEGESVTIPCRQERWDRIMKRDRIPVIIETGRIFRNRTAYLVKE